jgi:ribose-phosphate pyrophosphokinase
MEKSPQDNQKKKYAHRAESPRGPLLVAGCRSGAYLARKVFDSYRESLGEPLPGEQEPMFLGGMDGEFSDTETFVRLAIDVNGYDVYLFQALLDPASGRPVDHNYMAFLIAVRALREWGANQVTAVLPYLAYARQDKPTRFEREPTTANLMADLSIEAGISRLITWHPHSEQVQGFYNHIPVMRLESLSVFLEAFHAFRNREDVILVAPDAGAAKFVTHTARQMGVGAAIASKYRPRPEEVVINEVIGNFTGKRVAIVLDDMISSGGSVHSLVKELVQEKGIQEVHIGVSHNLCRSIALERLLDLHQNYALKSAVWTNSIPQTEEFEKLSFLRVLDISDDIALAINRIHYNLPMQERI